MRVELDDIQATVLRYRPEPYYGTHVMLAGRGCAGRPRVPAEADSARRFRRRVVEGRRSLDLGRHHLLRAGGAGRAGRLAPELPGSVPSGDGRARGRAPRPRRERPDALGAAVRRPGASTSASASSATPRRSGAAPWKWRGATTRDAPGLKVLMTQDFGAQPGDLNPLGYKDSIGQPAIEGSGVEPLPGQGPADQGRRVHPRLPRRGRRAASGATAGRAGTQRHLCRAAQVPVAGRHVQPLPASARSRRTTERELLAAKLVGRWRSGAPLTLAPTQDDPELGADPQRNNDFTYADDPHGHQVPLGSHMRRLNPRDTKTALLTDVNVHRIIRRSTTYGAPYDPDAVSPQDDETARGLSSSSSAPRRWPRWSSCSRSGSTTATSWTSATSAIRTSACRRRAPRSRSRASRSGAASTASRRSTCCAAASTSSCPPCRH